MKVSFLSVSTLLALGAIVWGGCKHSGSDSVKYDTEPAARGTVVQFVTASGTVSALVSVDVGCQVSGQISKLYVDYNSPVTNGELIAEIDPRTYDALVAQAKADLINAQSALALSKVTLERDEALLSKQIVAQADYDSAKASCEQAQAMVMIKQATLEQNQANLGYCKIASPTDGVVIARKVDVGQTVIAAMSTPVLFTIVQDLSKMNISAAVSEADIGRVRFGQPVDFTVDAYPEDTFHGTVAQVRKNPTTTQNVVTYEVIISADNPEQKLFPGMTADVSILAAQRTNTLEVPNAALRFTPPAQAVFEAAPPAALKRDERLIYVTSADGAKLRAVVVKAGITDGMKTEILDGLTNGAPVVTSAASAGRNNFGPPPPPPQ